MEQPGTPLPLAVIHVKDIGDVNPKCTPGVSPDVFDDSTGKVWTCDVDVYVERPVAPGPHTHVPALTPFRALIYLDNSGPVIGAVDSDFAVTIQYDNAGTLDTAPEVATVTEETGATGFYWVTFTPTLLGVYYQVAVAYTAGFGVSITASGPMAFVSAATYGEVA
jgi:hypothetical protein